MIERKQPILLATRFALGAVTLGLAMSCAQAGERRYEPVIVSEICITPDNEICVPRVLPGSVIKQYPYGRLRQDYQPYGMPGVSADAYFTYVEPNRLLPVRHMGKFPQVHKID